MFLITPLKFGAVNIVCIQLDGDPYNIFHSKFIALFALSRWLIAE